MALSLAKPEDTPSMAIASGTGTDTQIEIAIEGMDCASCARNIQTALTREGFASADVNFLLKRARFSLLEGQTVDEALRSIRQLGYRPHLPGKDALPEGWWTLERKALFAAFWTLPLALHMFVPWHWLHHPWVQLALCLPVFALGAAHFGLSALRSLRMGVANMDVLIFGGSAAAFLYSFYGTLAGRGQQFLFYETSATIIFAVLIGNLLEKRALTKATSALDDLSRLQASRAQRINGHGALASIETIELSQIRVDDLLLVNNGDRVPTDGIIEWGEVSVDQSMITGESLPIDLRAGGRLIGGTVVVRGSARVRASSVGEQTVLAEIIRLVSEAQRSKPDIQKLGDKVSGVFVPAVVLFSLATFALSLIFGVSFADSLLRAIAVLVVACPCAMGLATPTAVSIGLGKAARQGILLKGGSILERCAQVSRVVFDKTGTLTSGQFSIVALHTHGRDLDSVRKALKGLELHSSHPIARSIVTELPDVEPLPFPVVSEERGVGIHGTAADGRAYSLRRRAESANSDMLELTLECDGEPAATVVLQDELRPAAAKVISELTALGLPSVILSGDARTKTAAVAQKLGITDWHAEKRPEEKLQLLSEYERQGPTAFVGDGINDAPALTRASVGVSLSDGTQVAVHSAQVVLLHGNLEALPRAIRICRGAVRTIKQNLFWAFAYNLVALPLAALGYLSPMLAAFSMIFSDFVVIGNSLRYRYLVRTDE